MQDSAARSPAGDNDRALHRAVAALADVGDAAGVIALLASVPSGRFTPRLIARLSAAAVQVGSAEAARRAATLAIPAELPPEERARIARRLATPALRVPDLAWLVLTSDPAALLAPVAQADAVRALGAIAESAEPPLRAAAAALRRRVIRIASSDFEDLPPASPPGPALPAPAPGWLRLLRAPGVGPEAEGQFHDMAASFEAELAARPAPSTRLFREVFVNAAGQVWRADGRLLVDGLNSAAPVPLPPGSLAAMAAAPRIAEGEFATLRPSAGNFFHWMINGLPALSRHLPTGGVTLLAGRRLPDFVRQSLALAGAEWPVLPVGDATFVDRLLVSWSPVSALAWSDDARLMHERLIALADAEEAPGDAGPLLYISRRDSGFRAMENEAALEEVLAQRGFRVVALSGRPLLEQIRIVRAARLIVAPHGAGLAHLALARPGVAVLELMPLVTSLPLRFNMARLSRIRGHRHALWLAPTEAGNRWRADVAALLPEIGRMADAAG